MLGIVVLHWIYFSLCLYILTIYVSQHYYHLRNIARARRYLSFHTTDILVHAFVTMKLGNENTLLYGLPKDQIRNVSTCS